MKAERGFTLLEVIVALAVVAIGLAAITKAASESVVTIISTEAHLLGTWLASNRLADLRISRVFPGARETIRRESLGGQEWQFREKIATTADPDVLRVDIEVFTDKKLSRRAASLFGYLVRRSSLSKSVIIPGGLAALPTEATTPAATAPSETEATTPAATAPSGTESTTPAPNTEDRQPES